MQRDTDGTPRYKLTFYQCCRNYNHKQHFVDLTTYTKVCNDDIFKWEKIQNEADFLIP